MISKKAQGEFVAYVLLIGMAVGLAVLVGRWSIGQSQSASESFVTQSEMEQTCSQITISGYVDCASGSSNKIKISNRGYLTVNKLRIQGSECSGASTEEDIDPENGLPAEGLKPGKTLDNSITVSDSCKYGLILPMIKIKDQDVGCIEKRIQIELKC